jgi:hypothetical protein
LGNFTNINTRDFFPVVVGFLRRLPIIGNILSMPGISQVIIEFFTRLDY